MQVVGLEGGVAVLEVDVVVLVGQGAVEVPRELIAGAELEELVVHVAVVVREAVERLPLVAGDAVDRDHRRVAVEVGRGVAGRVVVDVVVARHPAARAVAGLVGEEAGVVHPLVGLADVLDLAEDVDALAHVEQVLAAQDGDVGLLVLERRVGVAVGADAGVGLEVRIDRVGDAAAGVAPGLPVGVVVDAGVLAREVEVADRPVRSDGEPLPADDGLGHRLLEVGELVVDADRRHLLRRAFPAAVADAGGVAREDAEGGVVRAGEDPGAVVPLGEQHVGLAAGGQDRGVLGADVEVLDVEGEADAERIVEVDVGLVERIAHLAGERRREAREAEAGRRELRIGVRRRVVVEAAEVELRARMDAEFGAVDVVLEAGGEVPPVVDAVVAGVLGADLDDRGPARRCRWRRTASWR